MFYHEYLKLLLRKDSYHYGKDKSTKIPIRPVYNEILQFIIFQLFIYIPKMTWFGVLN